MAPGDLAGEPLTGRARIERAHQVTREAPKPLPSRSLPDHGRKAPKGHMLSFQPIGHAGTRAPLHAAAKRDPALAGRAVDRPRNTRPSRSNPAFSHLQSSRSQSWHCARYARPRLMNATRFGFSTALRPLKRCVRRFRFSFELRDCAQPLWKEMQDENARRFLP